MFFTQDAKQLDLNGHWQPLGAYCEWVKGKTGHGGYGEGGYQGVIENATIALQAKYGLNTIVVNCKFEIAAGDAHPSYNRLALMISGDIYQIDTAKMFHDALARWQSKELKPDAWPVRKDLS